LVNHDRGNGKDLVQLAKYVQEVVFDRFKVMIEPEVRMVTEFGESSFDDLLVESRCINRGKND